MRNLNECQAEVFRRSKEKIEKRRRRNRTLAACIPSVLFLIAVSAVLLPGVSPEKAADSAMPESAMGSPTQNWQASLSDPVKQITVSGPGFSQAYTDASHTFAISDQLNACISATEDTEETVRGENYKENMYTGIADHTGAAGYTVTLVMHGDNITKYFFSGNTLKDLTSNKTYTLSQTQAEELKDLLGISQQ